MSETYRYCMYGCLSKSAILYKYSRAQNFWKDVSQYLHPEHTCSISINCFYKSPIACKITLVMKFKLKYRPYNDKMAKLAILGETSTVLVYKII